MTELNNDNNDNDVNDNVNDNDNNNDNNNPTYILLNCKNATVLRKYIKYFDEKNFNKYIFHNDMQKLFKNKKKILQDFKSFFMDKIGNKIIGDVTNIKKLGNIGKLGNVKSLEKLFKGGNPKAFALKKIPFVGSIASSNLGKKACKYFGSIAADSSKIRKSHFAKIKEFGNIIKLFGTEKKYRFFVFLGEIFTNQKLMQKLGKTIMVNAVCDDPMLSFQALVLKDPTAIAQLGLTGAQESLKQLDGYIIKKYNKDYQNFEQKIFPQCKIKCKVFTPTQIYDNKCIHQFNKKIKSIVLYDKDPTNILEITVNNIAVVSKKNYNTIQYDNITTYLISNISQIKQKCPK
jgi:hypothetical protein